MKKTCDPADSVDGMRRCSELGLQMGRQKCSKEIMNWARKKRRMIRREDLIAYLAGKPPPPRPHTHRYDKTNRAVFQTQKSNGEFINPPPIALFGSPGNGKISAEVRSDVEVSN